MIWLCEEMISHDGLKWPLQLKSAMAISKRYDIHVDGLRLWLKRYNKGETFSEDSNLLEQCIQPVLDGISARRITREINNCHDFAELDCVTLGKIEVEKSARRRHTKLRRKALQDLKFSSKRQHNY